MTEIRATEMSFQQLNEQIHTCQDAEITLTDVMGQRYIASGLSGKRLEIHGIPGNALAPMWTTAGWRYSVTPRMPPAIP